MYFYNKLFRHQTLQALPFPHTPVQCTRTALPSLHSVLWSLALTNFSLVYTDQGSCFYKSMACNLLACRTEQGWPQKTWKMTHISHLGAGCSTAACWAPAELPWVPAGLSQEPTMLRSAMAKSLTCRQTPAKEQEYQHAGFKTCLASGENLKWICGLF